MYRGMKPLLLAAVLTAMGAVPAQAACPPGAVGNTAAEIAAERQRVLCLQRELAEDTARRQQQIEIDALNRSIQQMQMQQRLNSLPVYQPPTFQ
jgi:hypothetical protein